MAYIEGNPADKPEKSLLGQMGFTLIAGFVLIFLMLFFSEDWKSDLYAVLTIVAVISAVIVFVLYKLNPLGWKKIFNRFEYYRYLEQEVGVIDRLKGLDDTYFILNDFSFELFHVEHLVVSKNGIFIIGKIRNSGRLNIKDNTLYSDDISQEALTTRMWRLSHLLNLIIKKGYNDLDIMPVPVIVHPDEKNTSIKDFNGIKIAGIDELKELIEKKLRFSIDNDIAESIALFMKQRYILKK